MSRRIFRVEDFGNVRPHQSEALNIHLQAHLEAFDKEFTQAGGQLGSPSHQLERESFAKTASESLLNSVENNLGNLSELKTSTKHQSGSLGVAISVESKTTFTPKLKPGWYREFSLN